MNSLYTAIVTARNGRNGEVASVNGSFHENLRVPQELGGNGKNGTNPEELFAAGYAACFQSALQLVIEEEQLSIEDTEVTAHVSLGKDTSDGYYKLAITLDVKILGVEKEEAFRLMEKAHTACPYSKAFSGGIEVKLNRK